MATIKEERYAVFKRDGAGTKWYMQLDGSGNPMDNWPCKRIEVTHCPHHAVVLRDRAKSGSKDSGCREYGIERIEKSITEVDIKPQFESPTLRGGHGS